MSAEWDPFGDDPPPPPAALKPARPPPAAPPKAAAGVDPFDPFGIDAAPAPAAAAATLPPPPSYEAAAVLPSTTAAAASDPSPPPPPPPPAYDAAASYEPVVAPPPPAYGAALDLPPPPSYEELFAATSSGGGASAAAPAAAAAAPAVPTLAPSRAAPPPPPGGKGPLNQGLAAVSSPQRRAAAAAAGLVPARAAPPPPPGAAGARPGSGLAPSRAPPPRPPPPAAAAAAAAPAADGQLRELSLADSGSSDSSDDVPAGAAFSRGAFPGASAAPPPEAAAAGLGSDLNLDRPECRALSVARRPGAEKQLSALLRLAPLRPKAAAPLKRLLLLNGCLFGAPAGDGAQLLQWCVGRALRGAAAGGSGGSTLPDGARRAPSEDWDSAPCALLETRLAAIDPDAAAAKSAVTCLAGHAPSGRVWAGTSDGRVHCWQVAGPGEPARWLHAWVAHVGKVKAVAVSPWGRVFTGAPRGAGGG